MLDLFAFYSVDTEDDFQAILQYEYLPLPRTTPLLLTIEYMLYFQH